MNGSAKTMSDTVPLETLDPRIHVRKPLFTIPDVFCPLLPLYDQGLPVLNHGSANREILRIASLISFARATG